MYIYIIYLSIYLSISRKKGKSWNGIIKKLCNAKLMNTNML